MQNRYLIGKRRQKGGCEGVPASCRQCQGQQQLFVVPLLVPLMRRPLAAGCKRALPLPTNTPLPLRPLPTHSTLAVLYYNPSKHRQKKSLKEEEESLRRMQVCVCGRALSVAGETLATVCWERSVLCVVVSGEGSRSRKITTRQPTSPPAPLRFRAGTARRGRRAARAAQEVKRWRMCCCRRCTPACSLHVFSLPRLLPAPSLLLCLHLRSPLAPTESLLLLLSNHWVTAHSSTAI